MKIHKTSYPEISILFFFILFVLLITQLTACTVFHRNTLFIIGLMFFFGALFFFRNPPRKVKSDSLVIYAPADGRIVAIEEVNENEYLNRKCIKVSIFMSMLNVHVNRFPVSGRISYTKYHIGNYFIASYPKSSDLNEHQTVVVEMQDGTEIMIKQIAGALARRVVCYAKTGEQAIQGEDLGFIKFGSRVDLFLPLSLKEGLLIKINENVKGNLTAIARFNN